MSEINFDLTTRVEEKPQDCGKRVSYSEINYGSNYYLLYNQQLHKVVINALTSNNCLSVKYLDEYCCYLGQAQGDEYLIDIQKYNAKFYEVI